MASRSNKATSAGDDRETNLLSSIEDKHYDLIDERGDHGSLNKLNVQEITKEWLATESGHSLPQSDSQSMAQSSCTLSTIMSTKDDDDSKKSVKSSLDGEIIVINEGNYCIMHTFNIYHTYMQKNLELLWTLVILTSGC